MPLRQWMNEHGHPGWYSWLVVIGGCLVSLVLAVTISVQVAQKGIQESERRQDQADQQGKAIACEAAQRIDDAYRREPPESAAGKEVAEAWKGLRRDFQCNGGT